MKRIILVQSLLIFLIVTATWVFCFPHTMRWAESVSYFSCSPDFTDIQAQLPENIFFYCGAFLLQAFRFPPAGALVVAALVWVIAMSFDVAIYSLTKRPRLMCLAMIPAAFAVALMPMHLSLAGPLLWCFISVCIALVAFLAGRLPFFRSLRAGGNAGWISYALVPALLLVVAAAYSGSRRVSRENERVYRLEHLAETGDWYSVIENISPDEARVNPVLKRFAMLSLIATGTLPDRMIEYGIRSADDMLFVGSKKREPRYINTFFYELLGADNEVIREMFELGYQSPFGMSNRSLRRLIEASIRQGKSELAEKYIEVLAATPFSGDLVRKYRQRLESGGRKSRHVNPEDGKVYLGNGVEQQVLTDSYRLMLADSTDRRKVDVFLSGLLASNNLDGFVDSFRRHGKIVYPEGSRLPRVYQEALMLAVSPVDSLLSVYPLENGLENAFRDFGEMRRRGDSYGVSMKYRNSYWAYHR